MVAISADSSKHSIAAARNSYIACAMLMARSLKALDFRHSQSLSSSSSEKSAQAVACGLPNGSYSKRWPHERHQIETREGSPLSDWRDRRTVSSHDSANHCRKVASVWRWIVISRNYQGCKKAQAMRLPLTTSGPTS